MNSNRSIGFVILVWNSEKVIAKCLDSILKLESIIPSVVVVDNGSTDSTPSVVQSYTERFPGIISSITYSENKGTTLSRNAGLKQLMPSSPDFYCILDSDTEVNDETFIKLVEEMDAHLEYGIIGPALITSSGFRQVSSRCFPTAVEKFFKAVPVRSLQAKGEAMEIQAPPFPNASSYPVDYLMSACWLMRPEALDKAGMLDENIFYAPEDAEYCIRMWKSGYKVAYCPQASIIHEWQRISKKKLISRMNWEHIKGLCYMFRKHHYFLTADKLRNTFER